VKGRIAALMLSAAVLLVIACSGCGRQAILPPGTKVQTGPHTTIGTTLQQTAGSPARTEQSQGGYVSYEDYCIEEQFAKATQGMSQQEATDYETGVIREAMARGLDPRTILDERGFTC
jgi:hypothetical protein